MASISVARVYDPQQIQPVVETGQNLGVLVQGDWLFFRVDHVEAVPASRQTTQDLGSVSDASSSGETEITVVRAQDGNLLHIRMFPLDDVELDVFHGRSTGGRHTTYSTKARISPATANTDNFHSLSTAFIFGKDRPMYINAYNETGYALAQSRVRFFGYRYRLDPLPPLVGAALRKHIRGIELEPGEIDMIKNLKVTLVPAEGRE